MQSKPSRLAILKQSTISDEVWSLPTLLRVASHMVCSGDIMFTEYGDDSTEIKEIMKNVGLKFKRIRLMENAVPSPADNMNNEQRERLSRMSRIKFMWVVTVR